MAHIKVEEVGPTTSKIYVLSNIRNVIIIVNMTLVFVKLPIFMTSEGSLQIDPPLSV